MDGGEIRLIASGVGGQFACMQRRKDYGTDSLKVEDRNQQRLDVWRSFAAFQEYVLKNEKLFPANAFMVATSGWWYTPNDYRCPHDAALERFTLSETDVQSGRRILNLGVRLISAHYCGVIEVSYLRVMSYALESRSCNHGMRDWFADRFFLSKRGGVVHDIKWAGSCEEESCEWLIEASDVKVAWIPDDPLFPNKARRA